MEDFHNCDQEKFGMVGASLGLGPRKIAFQYFDSHPGQATPGSEQSGLVIVGHMGSEATTLNITTALTTSESLFPNTRNDKRLDW